MARRSASRLEFGRPRRHASRQIQRRGVLSASSTRYFRQPNCQRRVEALPGWARRMPSTQQGIDTKPTKYRRTNKRRSLSILSHWCTAVTPTTPGPSVANTTAYAAMDLCRSVHSQVARTPTSDAEAVPFRPPLRPRCLRRTRWPLALRDRTCRGPSGDCTSRGTIRSIRSVRGRCERCDTVATGSSA